MKKLILLLLVLILFLSTNILYAQQKYKIVEEEKWKHNVWRNLGSIGGYVGKENGFKIDVLYMRFKYFIYGAYSFFNGKSNRLDQGLPIGLHYPLLTRENYIFGINSIYYLSNGQLHGEAINPISFDEKLPHLGEINLRFEHNWYTFSAGYRYQTKKWKENFEGFFIEASVGLMLIHPRGKYNDRFTKTRKIHLPNPSLKIKSKFSDYNNSIIGGEEKYLQITVNNNGKGLAEDVKLNIIIRGLLKNDLSFKRTYNLWNIQPYSKKTISIPLKANKELEKTKKGNIIIECTEKDGFTANDEIEITIQPEIQTEKFPPIFSINVNLKEPNGNLLLDALEKGEIEITIKNTGRGNAWAVEPEIEIEQSHIINYLKFDKNLLTIRKIEQGGTANVKIPIEADWEIPSGKVKMQIICREGNGFDSAPVNFSFETQEFLEPELVITDVGIDDSESINTFGDGDNIIENMETIEVTAIVQNQGQGKAKDVKAKIIINNENMSFFGDELYSLGDLKTGEFESLKFTILVNNKYSGGINLPIKINVTEYYKKYGISNKNLGLELNKITLASKDINIEGRKHIWQKIPKTPVLSVDIEKDLPKSDLSIDKGIAVVIGNKDYDFYPENSVEYAINDKRLTERYSENLFKYRTILGGENLGFAKFRNIFGTEVNPEGELYRTLREKEPVFIYITGHGHSKPQLNQKAVSYIVTKDGNGYDLDATCYPIDNLYQNLSHLIERKKPEKLILILDMCFSGYLTTAISSARWESDNPLQDLIDIGNNVGTDVVCIFATQEAQTAKWYQEKKHGLLTYFVLKAFHNSENEGGYKADYNNDKKLTLGELKRFVLDENYGVPYFANQKEVVGNSDLGQLPVIIGDNDIILLEYK